MPAHGRPVFLAEAVESVLAQTQRDLRLVVLDDSQGEEIAAAIEPYVADERVEHRRVAPMTATRAMTELMQAGSAPYFAFLHDDDRWGAEFLERRVAFLEANPDCGLVFGGHADIDVDGREVARSPIEFPEGVVPREVIVPTLLRRPVITVMHGALIRRSALEEAGAHLDDRFPRLFDLDLWLRLGLRFPVGALAVVDAYYRGHPEQMSGVPGHAADFVALWEHADELARELAPDLRLSERDRARQRARLELSLALDGVGRDEPGEARAALRRAMQADRRAVLGDRRLPALLLALAAGRRGRAAVTRLRAAIYRRQHRRRTGQA